MTSTGLCRNGQYVASRIFGPPLGTMENCFSMPSPALSSWNAENLVPQRGPITVNIPPYLSPLPLLTGLVCVTVPVPRNLLAILPIHFPCCSVRCASISTMTSILFLLILWMTSCNLAAVSSAMLSVHTVRSLSRFYPSAWSVLYAPVLSLVIPVPFISVSVSRRSLNDLFMICCWVVLDVTGGKNDGFEMHRAVVLVLLRWRHRGWCFMYAYLTAVLFCFSGSSSVCGVEGSVSRFGFCQKRRPCRVGYSAAVLRVSMYSPLVQVAHEYDADCSLGRKICQLVTYLSRWPRVC